VFEILKRKTEFYFFENDLNGFVCCLLFLIRDLNREGECGRRSRKKILKKNDDVHNSGVAAISPATMPK
jgi:hypothetical protein